MSEDKKSEKVKSSAKKQNTNEVIEETEPSIRINIGTVGIFAVIVIIIVGVSLRVAAKRYEAKIAEIQKRHQLSPEKESHLLSKIQKRMDTISKELLFEKKNGENQLKQLVLAKEEIENQKEQIELLRKEIANKSEQIRLLYEAQEDKNGAIKLLRARNEKLRQTIKTFRDK